MCRLNRPRNGAPPDHQSPTADSHPPRPKPKSPAFRPAATTQVPAHGNQSYPDATECAPAPTESKPHNTDPAARDHSSPSPARITHDQTGPSVLGLSPASDRQTTARRLAWRDDLLPFPVKPCLFDPEIFQMVICKIIQFFVLKCQFDRLYIGSIPAPTNIAVQEPSKITRHIE